MNKYKHALQLAAEFLRNEELSGEAGNFNDTMVRQGIVKELEEWADWITADDAEDQVLWTDRDKTIKFSVLEDCVQLAMTAAVHSIQLGFDQIDEKVVITVNTREN